MADDVHTVRAIDYRSAFPFVSIFKSFRVAVDPSKLGLALVGLLALYFGGRLMDLIWPNSARAIPHEVDVYAGTAGEGELRQQIERDWRGQDDQAGRNPAFGLRTAETVGPASEVFKLRREAVRKGLLDSFHDDLLRPTLVFQEEKKDKAKAFENAAARDKEIKDKPETFDNYVGDVKEFIAADRNKARDAKNLAFDERWKTAPTDDKGKEDKVKDRKIVDAEIAALYRESVYLARRAEAVKGEGLFITFLDYESNQLNGIVDGAVHLNPGVVIDSIYNLVAVGPVWAIRHHPVYFTVFFLFMLLLWAVFGGAIARIAAVQVARDEKISVRQALRFSVGKVLSFVFAPLIPLLIIVAIGAVVAVGGALGNIPGIGPVLVGGLFIFALLAGLVLALTALGLLGGFGLMYPTIAVEGSDSFDAVSRSFSYLYARPWQLAFYTTVALIYGAICYMFVRFFVYVLMKLTHLAAGAFVFRDAPTGQNQFQAMWPEPASSGNLSYNLDTFALGTGQAWGAGLLAFWNYLLIALVGAFAISLYFSANTIIYYLMRKEVDATEIDDVYLEQTDDDFIDTATPAPTGDTLTPALAGGSATTVMPVTTTTASTVRTDEINIEPTAPDTDAPR